MDTVKRCCILVVFKDQFEDLACCIQRLEPQLNDEVDILLVDDGSNGDPISHPAIARLLKNDHAHLVQHSVNRGVSAARNTGIKWCLKHGYDLVLMIDSDCKAPLNYVETHRSLHRRFPDIPVIGGAIRGVGNTLWSTLDGMMTWFHVIPGSPGREIP
ncbi:MAG: glycosyltransferase family 2 protein, partial [Planctomycetota bacterium]